MKIYPSSGGVNPSDDIEITGDWTKSSDPQSQYTLVSADWVNRQLSGLPEPKGSVVTATFDALSLSGLPIVSGVQLVAGDRVLYADNDILAGIYIADSGSWSRSLDWEVGEDVGRTQISVTGGDFSGNVYINTVDPCLVGTDIPIFSLYLTTGYTAGPGLSLSNRQFSVISSYRLLLDNAASTPTESTLALRDSSGDLSANTFIGSIAPPDDASGNVGTEVLRFLESHVVDSFIYDSLTAPFLANGVLKSNSGSVSSSLLLASDIDPSTQIPDSNLQTISTSGKVSNSATTAAEISDPGTIVLRSNDGSIYGNYINAGSGGNGYFVFNKNFGGYQVAFQAINSSTFSGSAVRMLFQTNGGSVSGNLTFDYFGQFYFDRTVAPEQDVAYSLGTNFNRWLSVYAATFFGNLSGNASTATALQNARNIYGNSFNGTADVSGIIGSQFGGTENGFTAFSGPSTTKKTFTLPNANCSILTTNSPVTVTQGGTGLTSTSQGDLLYSSAANTITALPKNTTATRYLANTGLDNSPAWAQINLGTGIVGVLPVPNGGTGISSVSQGDILYASAPNTLLALPKNTNATRYLANTGASNSPQWDLINIANGVTGTLSVANGGTGNTTYSNGELLIGNSSGNTLTKAKLTAGVSVSITNGNGSISINTVQNIRTTDSPTFNGLTLNADATFQKAGSGVTNTFLLSAGTNGVSSSSNFAVSSYRIYGVGGGAVTGYIQLNYNTPNTLYEMGYQGDANVSRHLFNKRLEIRNAYTNGGVHPEERTSRLFLGSNSSNYGVGIVSRVAANGTVNASDLILQTCDNVGALQDRVFILGTSNGNGGFVGLNTASPETRLHVLGDATVQATGTGVTAISHVKAGTVGSATPANLALRKFTIVGNSGSEVSCFDSFLYDGVLNKYKRRFDTQDLFTVDGIMTIDAPISGGSLKLLHLGENAGEAVWIGMCHGSNSADNNDRARLRFQILSGGAAFIALTTGTAGAQVDRLTLSSTNFSVLPDAIFASRLSFGNQGSWDVNVQFQGPNSTSAQSRCYAWLTYSDMRLKENIEDVDPIEALYNVCKIRYVRYNWIKNQGDNLPGMEPQKQYGYIAQDVWNTFPHACVRNDKGIPTSVDYAKVNTAHTGAIKAIVSMLGGISKNNLFSKIEELEKRIKALENAK